MTEDQLQKQVKEYLTIRGIYHFHLPRNIGRKRNQTSGIFDLMCIGYGKQFWIELKHPEKKPKEWKVSKDQFDFDCLLKANKIQHIMSNSYKQIIDFVEGVIG